MKANRLLPIGALPCALSLALYLPAATAQTERELGAHVHGAAEMQLVLDGNALLINFQSPAANLVGFEHEPRTAEEKSRLAAVEDELRDLSNVIRVDDDAGCAATAAVVGWHRVGMDDHDHEAHDEHGEHEKHEEHEHKEGHEANDHDGHEEHAHEEEHEEHAHEEEHEEHAHEEEHEEHAHEEEHEAHAHGGEHDHDGESGSAHAEFIAEYNIACSQPDRIGFIDVVLFDRYPALETLALQAVLPSGQTAASLTPENHRVTVGR